MILGKFTTRSTCRLCNSTELELFLDLGMMPLAGDYLKSDQVGSESFYPLSLHRCLSCALVQVLTIISPDVLFRDYRYLSSIGLKAHFRSYAREMVSRFELADKKVLEIGSNDGVLLGPLKERGVNVLGIDPASNVSNIAINKGINTLIKFFDASLAVRISKDYGKMDAIFANNVLAHIDAIEDVFEGITQLLNPTGVLIFEVHYLIDLMKKLQYDFFYHEHLNYYCLTSLSPFLKRFNLEIFDIKRIPIHSGSIRVYVKFVENKNLNVSHKVKNLLDFEQRYFDKGTVFSKFNSKILETKRDLVIVLNELKARNMKVVGYGAAGRANTLLNYCEIDDSLLKYIVDESPERVGRYTPGTHIPIVLPAVFHSDNIDYVLILAWNYKKMIMKKESFFTENGNFIVPLPHVKIYEKNSRNIL